MEASRPDEALVVAGQMREVEHRVDLAGILETLAPEHREVLVLREIQGLAYGEIAQMLRVPQGTVESRLHRARSALRERLKGYGS